MSCERARKGEVALLRRLRHQTLGEGVERALVDQVGREEDVAEAGEAERRLLQVREKEDVVVDERVAEAERRRRELSGDGRLRFGVVSG